MARYPLDDWTLRNPISGVFGCCAREAGGHATTVLLKSLMNSRRLMASLRPRRGLHRVSKEYHIVKSRIVPFVTPKRAAPMSALGQKQTLDGGR
jgi:hypothetical protein